MSSHLNLNKLLLGILGLQLTVAGGAISINVEYGTPWALLIHLGLLVTIAAFFVSGSRTDSGDEEPAGEPRFSPAADRER